MKRSFVGLFWSSGTLLLNGFTIAFLLPKSHLIVYKIKGTDVVPRVSLAQVRVLMFMSCLSLGFPLYFHTVFVQSALFQQCLEIKIYIFDYVHIDK